MLAFNGAIGNYNGQPGTDGYTPIEVNIIGNMYVYASRENEPIGVAINGTVMDEEVLSAYDNYVSDGLVLFNGRIQGGERMLDFHRARLAKWFKSSSPKTALKSNDPTLFGSDVIRSLLEDEWFEPATDFLVEGSEYESVYIYETVSYDGDLDGIDDDRTIADIETFDAYNGAEEELMPFSEEEWVEELNAEEEIAPLQEYDVIEEQEDDEGWFISLLESLIKDSDEEQATLPVVDVVDVVEEYEAEVIDLYEVVPYEREPVDIGDDKTIEDIEDFDAYDNAEEILMSFPEDESMKDAEECFEGRLPEIPTEADEKREASSEKIKEYKKDSDVGLLASVLDFWTRNVKELTSQEWFTELFNPWTKDNIKESVDEFIEDYEHVVDEIVEIEAVEEFLEASEEVVEELKDKAGDWLDTAAEFLKEEDDFATYPPTDVLDDSIDDYADISRDIIDRGTDKALKVAEEWLDTIAELLKEEDEDFATYPQTDVLNDSIDDYAAISRDMIDRGTDKTIEVVEDLLATSEEAVEEVLAISKEAAKDLLEDSEEVLEELKDKAGDWISDVTKEAMKWIEELLGEEILNDEEPPSPSVVDLVEEYKKYNTEERFPSILDYWGEDSVVENVEDKIATPQTIDVVEESEDQDSIEEWLTELSIETTKAFDELSAEEETPALTSDDVVEKGVDESIDFYEIVSYEEEPISVDIDKTISDIEDLNAYDDYVPTAFEVFKGNNSVGEIIRNLKIQIANWIKGASTTEPEVKDTALSGDETKNILKEKDSYPMTEIIPKEERSAVEMLLQREMFRSE
ncbi:MAG: hypothetical protein HN685_06545 [Waddliaceae bacterium]|nr:hypothetical protein [Waddliaceae bacterium]